MPQIKLSLPNFCLWIICLIHVPILQAQLLLETLSLQDALHLALERNPEVKAVENNVAIAAAARSQASRRLNPAVTFSVENLRPISANQGPFFQTTEKYALFSYEIETAAKRRLRTNAAARAEESAEAALENRKRQLALEVYRAYFTAARAQSDLDVAEDVLADVDRVVELNTARYRTGEISGGELKRIELERLRFLDEVFTARLEVRNTKSALLALLNISSLEQDFELADSLGTTPAPLRPYLDLSYPAALEELRQKGLRQRPDLQAALGEERRADTETLHQKAIRSANLTVTGGWKRMEGLNTVAVGITMPLKIFNRNQDGITQAEAELARARNLAEATRIALLLEIQQAFNAVQVNRERLRYIERDYLEKSEESRRILTASYRMGEADLIDLLDAERTYRESRRIYNQALCNYRISLSELAAAVGEEFTS